MPDPFKQPTEYLLTFLGKLSALDKEGFFQRPVREEEAPNYYTVIKQPMCFADMRAKVNAGAYHSWRQLRDDFALIHDNAKRFNSNKTLVHKAAINLQKNGNKIMAAMELEVRKALAVLHPMGPQGTGQDPNDGRSPAAEELPMDLQNQPSQQLFLAQRADSMVLDPRASARGTSAPPSPADGLLLQGDAATAGAMRLDTRAGSMILPGSAPGSATTAAAAAQQGLPGLPHAALPPPPRDPLVGYLSDDEKQPLLVAGTDGAAAAVAAAAACTLPGSVPTYALPMDYMVGQLRVSAVRMPYMDGLVAAAAAAAGGEGAGGADAGPGAGEGGAMQRREAAQHSGQLSREWKQARRSVEWQARWLELRMRELRGQQQRLRSQIEWMQQRAEAGASAAAGAGAGDGAAALSTNAAAVVAHAACLAAAPCAAEQEALAEAVRAFTAGPAGLRSAAYFRLRAPPSGAATGQGSGEQQKEQQQGSAAGAEDADANGARGAPLAAPPLPAFPPACPTSFELQPPAPGTAAPQPLHHQQPSSPSPFPAQPDLVVVDEEEGDKLLPAAMFAALELLDHKLCAARARIQDVYRLGELPPRAPSLGLGTAPSLPLPLQLGASRGSVSLTGVPSGSVPFPGQAGAGALTGRASVGAAPLPGMLGQQQQQPPQLNAGAGAGGVKRQSSSQAPGARRAGSLTVLTRFDSMGGTQATGGKGTLGMGGGAGRKRSEAEMLAGEAGLAIAGTPLGAFGRSSLDRSAVSGGFEGSGLGEWAGTGANCEGSTECSIAVTRGSGHVPYGACCTARESVLCLRAEYALHGLALRSPRCCCCGALPLLRCPAHTCPFGRSPRRLAARPPPSSSPPCATCRPTRRARGWWRQRHGRRATTPWVRNEGVGVFGGRATKQPRAYVKGLG